MTTTETKAKDQGDTTPNPLDSKTREFKAGLKRRSNNRKALLEWIGDNLSSGSDFMRVKSKKTKKWSKPFLTKSGAEKILSILGVTPVYPNLDEEISRLSSGSAIFVVKCDLVNQHGVSVGTGAGGRTLEQDDGDVNKCIKMALKSAMIDATLRFGGLSQVFSQDRESASNEDVDALEVPVTDLQAKQIKALAKEISLPIKNVEEFFEVSKIEDLPRYKFKRCMAAIEKRRGHRKEEVDEK